LADLLGADGKVEPPVPIDIADRHLAARIRTGVVDPHADGEVLEYEPPFLVVRPGDQQLHSIAVPRTKDSDSIGSDDQVRQPIVIEVRYSQRRAARSGRLWLRRYSLDGDRFALEPKAPAIHRQVQLLAYAVGHEVE
jgi:hypothetical protein